MKGRVYYWVGTYVWPIEQAIMGGLAWFLGATHGVAL
jgi:hypothetical protein